MPNTSTSPLLQPPPSDITEPNATRQWMVNIFAYLANLSRIATTSVVLSSTGAGSVTLKSYNGSGTLLNTQTITGV